MAPRPSEEDVQRFSAENENGDFLLKGEGHQQLRKPKRMNQRKMPMVRRNRLCHRKDIIEEKENGSKIEDDDNHGGDYEERKNKGGHPGGGGRKEAEEHDHSSLRRPFG